MKVFVIISLISVASAGDSSGFFRVPDYEVVQDLFSQKVEPGPSLSTNPLVDASNFPALVPGLRAGIQAAVGSSQLGVVSNVASNLRLLTQPIGACYYWCRTNQGQVYCCESDSQNPYVPIPKPGKCPATCPDSSEESEESCRLDVDCSGAQKCCINPCEVQERVCRDPIPLEELKSNRMY